jgi:hypothetical protein
MTLIQDTQYKIVRCPLVQWKPNQQTGDKRSFDVLERWSIEGKTSELFGFKDKKQAINFLKIELNVF